MKESRYRVEVCQEYITPITVNAASISEAKEKVLHGEGEAGDTYPNETRVSKVVLLGKPDHG